MHLKDGSLVSTADRKPADQEDAISENKLHPIIKLAGREFADGKLDRREFLRVGHAARSLGAGGFRHGRFDRPRPCAGHAEKGGRRLSLGSRVQDLKSPHTYSWVEGANAARQTLDYLTYTGVDNVTRPNLVEKWDPVRISESFGPCACARMLPGARTTVS